MTSAKQTSENAIKNIRDEVYEEYGIYFPEEKLYQFRAKIKKRLRKLDIESIRSYRDYLADTPGEVSAFLDAISTNTTRFYREPRHWEFYRELLNENWLDRRRIRAWSAACSSGEEPYTLAMVTEEEIPNSSPAPREGFDYRILATDLSDAALRRGIRGWYEESTLAGLRKTHPHYVREYFTRGDGDRFLLREGIRDRVTFRKFNLKSPQYHNPSTFDLILVRNVLIYFDDDVITHVVRNLSRCLKPGGYLFVGHSESLSSIEHDLEKIRPAIYRKVDS